jgi:hypothetical protein
MNAEKLRQLFDKAEAATQEIRTAVGNARSLIEAPFLEGTGGLVKPAVDLTTIRAAIADLETARDVLAKTTWPSAAHREEMRRLNKR